jgi:hypothetical protein
MTIANASMAARAAAMIKRWGRPAALRRNGSDRDIIAGTLDFSPRANRENLDGAQRVIVAAPVSPAPDHELDQLVMDGNVFNIIEPVKGPRPANIAMFYDLAVVYVGPA